MHTLELYLPIRATTRAAREASTRLVVVAKIASAATVSNSCQARNLELAARGTGSRAPLVPDLPIPAAEKSGGVLLWIRVVPSPHYNVFSRA